MTTYTQDQTGRRQTYNSFPLAVEWAVNASQHPHPQSVEVGWVGLGAACKITNGVAVVDAGAEYVKRTALAAGATVEVVQS